MVVLVAVDACSSALIIVDCGGKRTFGCGEGLFFDCIACGLISVGLTPTKLAVLVCVLSVVLAVV